MADLIQIELGAAPWKPSEDAVVVREYQYHDFPLSGIVSQHDTDFLFMCVTGQDEGYNYWMYVHVLPETREYLESAGSSREFDERINGIGWDQLAMLAFAGDAFGILGFAEFHTDDTDSLRAATDRIAQQLGGIVAAERHVVPA